MIRRWLLPSLAATLGLAACAGSANGTSSSASASPTPAFDPCLVGTWTTTGVSGTQASSGASVSGGAGQVVTIRSNGTITIDPSGSQPVQLTVEGQTYTVSQSGMGSGTITSTGDQLTYRTGTGDSLSSTISGSDGTAIGTPAPDTGFTATYTCSAGQSMSIDEGGVTYDFSAGNSASTSSAASASPTPT